MKTYPGGTKGFSLIELLVVIAIVAVLAGLLIPAGGNIQRGMGLTQAGDTLQGQINLARATAQSRNRTVEVRLYSLPDTSPGSGPAYRAVQSFVYDEKGSNPVALDKLQRLPSGVILATEAGYSTILDAPTRTGTQKIPAIGTADYAFKGFRFRINGGTDLDLNGPGGSGTDTWALTARPETDVPRSGGLPKNFYTVQVDPSSGATMSFRP